MEKTHFVALNDIGAAEKVRLLVYAQPQAAKIAHAPLSALMRAGFVRDQGTGWRLYADGTLIQWGESRGIDPLITFPRAFHHNCWHISLTSHERPTPDGLVVRNSVDVTRFSFTAVGHFVDFQGGSGPAETGFSWMAWGS